MPHTFLYYFEGEAAESPRGVIDLEYYTDIVSDEKNVIKVRVVEWYVDGTTRERMAMLDHDYGLPQWAI